MNEDKMNIELRKFLKKVGITSQREIEKAVLAAITNNDLKGDETLNAKVVLEIPEINLVKTIEDTISLE